MWGHAKRRMGMRKEIWGEGRGGSPGMAEDNHSPLGNRLQGQDPSQGS